MVFKPGDKVFSYEAIGSEEQLKKEASKLIGEPIEIIRNDGKITSGIFANITKRQLAEYSATIITTSNEMTHKEYILFRNNWSDISVQPEIKKITIGDGLTGFTPEKNRNVIRNLFAALPL